MYHWTRERENASEIWASPTISPAAGIRYLTLYFLITLATKRVPMHWNTLLNVTCSDIADMEHPNSSITGTKNTPAQLLTIPSPAPCSRQQLTRISQG